MVEFIFSNCRMIQSYTIEGVSNVTEITCNSIQLRDAFRTVFYIRKVILIKLKDALISLWNWILI